MHTDTSVAEFILSPLCKELGAAKDGESKINKPLLACKSGMLLATMQALKAGETGDEDIIRLAAEDAELGRAKERLTLKHRNSSKWARRALKRGMDVMDEGTKAAVAEQLRLGEELRRKVLPSKLCNHMLI